MKVILSGIVCSLLSLSLFSTAYAASSGGSSIGGFFGTTGSSQSDLNTVITNVNTANGVSVGKLTSAWEFAGHWTYRFSGIVALQFRPSFFYQTDSSGAYEFSVTGFTLFPIFKFYWLESNYIKFFTQVGVGWGFATTEIKESGGAAKASGNNMGFLAGLGAEFCFFGGNHCVDVEGNFRYLPFERLTVDSSSGTLKAGTSSGGADASGKELEYSGADLGATFSGIMGIVGYTYYF